MLLQVLEKCNKQSLAVCGKELKCSSWPMLVISTYCVVSSFLGCVGGGEKRLNNIISFK